MAYQICSCGERMYYTGEHHPTLTPIRFYACSNKHMKKVYSDPEPDWGDRSITRAWREAVTTGSMDGWSVEPNE